MSAPREILGGPGPYAHPDPPENHYRCPRCEHRRDEDGWAAIGYTAAFAVGAVAALAMQWLAAWLVGMGIE